MNINLLTLINVTINQLLKVVIIVIINHFNHEIDSCYVIMMCYQNAIHIKSNSASQFIKDKSRVL